MPATALSAYDAQSLMGCLRFLELLVDFREARIAGLLAEFSTTAPPRYDVRTFRIELTRFRAALGDTTLVAGGTSGKPGNDAGTQPEF
jgi:hypothetical protein